jgi:putative flippase GtrA
MKTLMRVYRTWRQARFAVVSLLSALLAEVGLAVGYGVAHWGVPAAVLLSFVISAPVSYVLNRQMVWRREDRPPNSRRRELFGFFVVALVGTVVSIAIIAAAEDLARLVSTQHLVLSAVVDLAGLFAMFTVWVARYVVLDQFVFRPGTTMQAQN